MHPNSLKNLQRGSSKTKAGVKKFCLSQSALDYLAQFQNMTAEIERLIAKAIKESDGN